MNRFLLVLVALAAVVVASRPRRRRVYGTTEDAFPFPTRDVHDAVDLDDPASVARWCKTYDCDEAQLRAAVRAAGRSPGAIEAHLNRPR